MLDPAFPKGALNYWKAQFLTDLSDEAIRTLVSAFEQCPSPMSMIVIEHFHGAASRVPVSATACTMRDDRLQRRHHFAVGQARRRRRRGMAWARQTHLGVDAVLAPMRYVNYLEDDAVDPAACVYGPNLAKLRDLKKKYDPDNFFRQNVNITPA